MAFGPGKYDDVVTRIRAELQAAGVLLIVIGGAKGGGFSAQLSPLDMLRLPETLRNIADQIDQKGPGV
jgi:hypothetical protein